MKLLIVSYSYFPAAAPRALRWTAIAEHWTGQGHSVDVVSARRPGSLAFEVRNRVRIHRIADPLGLLKGRTNVLRSGGNASGSGADFPRLKHALANLARKVYEHTWKRIYWPDYACLWIPPAYRRARQLIARNSYDALITVSFPFASHVVGLLLQRDFMFKPWVCDIGDPFSYADETPPNNRFLYGSLNRRVEKRILESATAAAVSTDETATKYVELFGLDPKYFTTIPPLASTEVDGPNGQDRTEEQCQSPAIKLVFLGILYRWIRDPEFLLKILSRLAHLPDMPPFEMHFVGELGGCEEMVAVHQDAIGKRLFVHGRVDRSQALEFLRRADILVNIGNKTAYQLPSKVIEYAATGKPILNIAAIDSDSARKVLQGYPYSLTVTASDQVSDDVVRQVKDFVRTPCQGNKELVEKYLEPFTVPAIAEQYIALIKSEKTP